MNHTVLCGIKTLHKAICQHGAGFAREGERLVRNFFHS